ncbi:MAG: hypothetical protein E5Y31_20970 [Mesorhizobium sp.]|nr:MAG: hypothetical protein E5Y31_20970 [Mesorhizobium sp.]
MLAMLKTEWSRRAALRVIFAGLAFSGSVWILGVKLADLFYGNAMPLYHFFYDGWATAMGLCVALLGGYKFVSRSD